MKVSFWIQIDCDMVLVTINCAGIFEDSFEPEHSFEYVIQEDRIVGILTN